MRIILFGAAALMALPVVAGADCETLKTSIDAKLQAKHVEGYSLDVRDASEPGEGKVIGHCEGDKKVIVYQRGKSDEGAKSKPDETGK